MLTSIAGGLSKLMDVRSLVCPECHGEFARLTETGKCWGCTEKQVDQELRKDAADRILGNMEAEITGRLERMGMASEEAHAMRELVPVPVKTAIATVAQAAVLALIEGRLPKAGFGIHGPTGIGKSFALAALLRVYVEQALRRRAPVEGEVPQEMGVCWCSWPAEAEWMRAHGADSSASYRRLQFLVDIPLLILDDLGAERIKGSYEEDYAVGKLDLIVDGRSRENRPIIWTSNLDQVALARRYGSRMVSRLVGQNAGAAAQGKDLRLQRK